MRIFKLKLFHKWARKEGLTNKALKDTIQEMEKGLLGNELGGFVYKKRVAIQGRGKRSGVRTLIAFKYDEKVFFMYGFAKNQRDNINVVELEALKRLAKELFRYNDNEIDKAIKAKEIIEVV
ncbi:protein containing DUF1044 [Candidatus Magnetomorum sp. HK-1]|nr:protein containing DUF1044 [Candidatus Magnetomorum sp. HK-1]